MATLRVLIVEDDATDAELVVRELKKSGFEPESRRVDTRDAFLIALEESSPDVIIYDHNLPHFSSSEALQLTRQRDQAIPFIIVSHAIGDEDAVALMRAGAADYLLKDRLGRLGEAVRHALEQRTIARRAYGSPQCHRVAQCGFGASDRVEDRAIEGRQSCVGNGVGPTQTRRRSVAPVERRPGAACLGAHTRSRRVQPSASGAGDRTHIGGAARTETVGLPSSTTTWRRCWRWDESRSHSFVRKSQGRRPAVQQLVAEVDSLLEKAGEYTRSLMAKLNPPVLDELGLPSALTWLAKQMPLHGLLVEVRLLDEQVPLPDDQAVLLFQSVRELLINVAKHAGTDRASGIVEGGSGAATPHRGAGQRPRLRSCRDGSQIREGAFRALQPAGTHAGDGWTPRGQKHAGARAPP